MDLEVFWIRLQPQLERLQWSFPGIVEEAERHLGPPWGYRLGTRVSLSLYFRGDSCPLTLFRRVSFQFLPNEGYWKIFSSPQERGEEIDLSGEDLPSLVDSLIDQLERILQSVGKTPLDLREMTKEKVRRLEYAIKGCRRIIG